MGVQNTFLMGPVVPSAHMIGYRNMRSELENWATGPCCGVAISGMHRTGKSSLANEIYEKMRSGSCGKTPEGTERKLVAVYLVLDMIKANENQSWYSTLLQSIVDAVEKELLHKVLGAVPDLLDDVEEELLEKATEVEPEQLEKLEKELMWAKARELEPSLRKVKIALTKFRSAPPELMLFRTCFQEVFSTLNRQGWQCRIILDEFDYAAQRDTFQDTADFELFRDLANHKYGVGMLLISRRELYLIEKKNRQNSVFNGVFNKFRLVGFQETERQDGTEKHRDMTEYYAVLRERYNIELSEEERQELRYYTGWNPLLLSVFGYELAQAGINGETPMSMEGICRKKQQNINDYLNTVSNRLHDDEGADGIPIIQKLVGIVLGPSIDITAEDIDLLTDMGYLMPTGNPEQPYQCISGLFTRRLANTEIRCDTWDLILETERVARRLIEREFQTGEERLSEDAWFAILKEAFLRVDHQDLNTSVYKRDIRVNRVSYGVELSVPDVISLKDCFRVIRAFWDSNFAEYFKKDKKSGTLGQWENDFEACGKARNPFAHGNAAFLNATERNRVNLICEDIIQTVKANMSKTPSGIPDSVKLPEAAAEG